MANIRKLAAAALAALALAGCAQDPQVVLIREPGDRQYGPPAPVEKSAADLWQPAVLSARVYESGENAQRNAPQEVAAGQSDPPGHAYAEACRADPLPPLPPLRGWTRWENFPSPALKTLAANRGLNVEVWETDTPPTLSVVFEGTNFWSKADWVSNLRWFIARFVPKHVDQYTLVSQELGKEFVDEFVSRKPNAGAVRIISTGHSLGGGLAQHFAYSLPPAAANGVPVPRVARVYAFDPSPVTGWFSVDKDLRERNARGLVIDRVFEHGEVLAYVRLIQSYVMPPSVANPAVREIRYNFVRTLNPIRSHSMHQLACDLAQAALATPQSASD